MSNELTLLDRINEELEAYTKATLRLSSEHIAGRLTQADYNLQLTELKQAHDGRLDPLRAAYEAEPLKNWKPPTQNS